MRDKNLQGVLKLNSLESTFTDRQPYPTPAQIHQMNYLNANPHLLVDFVNKQRANQDPPLPNDSDGGFKSYYREDDTRTLTLFQRQKLVLCLNSPNFSFVIIGPFSGGPFTAHLIKITEIHPQFFYYRGWWLDPEDGVVKYQTIYDAATWGVSC